MKQTNIICISTHYWHDFWFRKQHFMSRFAKLGHRVLYVQPTHSMIRKSPKPDLAKNKIFRPILEQISDKITLFSPPRLLPKPNEPISSKCTYQWHSWLLGQAIKKLGMNDCILWIYRPQYALGLNLIPHRHLVFDLADDLTAYNTTSRQYHHIAQCVDKLATSADLMVVTSPTLHDMYRDKTDNCVLVPNGFDETLFDGNPKPSPEDLSLIPGPIVGFVGVLFSFLDYDLIYETAKRMPNVSFVFVGPVEKSGRSGVDKIQQLKNTYFLGPKPRQAIPAYISNFDVCINPFQVDAVSRAVSPLKVYEYLSMGKPVISTPMDGLARETAGKWVHFTQPSAFAATITDLLNSTPAVKQNPEQVAAAKAFSWSTQFEKLIEHVSVVQK